MHPNIDTTDPTHDVYPAPTDTRLVDDTPANLHPRYPAAAFRGPLFETRDRIALAMATLMLIGPLAVMPLGLG
ncbi:hypothetical protein J5J10_05470 [Ciceribacter sp. L1K23]|uniref:hypothetical protein n=1 Tax=Ciceribacter sp. L1K23 TaxID=2820276 RepID=UPI001B8451A9|nr:hypothetical protein [Ciceribacter sp. L1K23]MBR0555126.1 hypothetical protein [Ciceribacter sp. L1K23]